MKQVAMKIIRQPVVVAITCDRCGRAVDESNVLEMQEWLSIRIDGGYASIFGDGARLACDLCQECVQVVLGPFLKPIPDPNEESRNAKTLTHEVSCQTG